MNGIQQAKRKPVSMLRRSFMGTWLAVLLTWTGCASTQTPPTQSAPTQSVPTQSVPTQSVPTQSVPTQSSLDPSLFHVVRKKVFDDPSFGTAYTFEAEGSELTVTAYSYPASPTENPNATKMNRVTTEVGNVLGGLQEMQKSGRYSDLDWKTYTSGEMPDGSVIIIQPVTLRIGGEKVKSFIVVSLKNEEFLKLRLTHPATLESYSAPEVGDFARAIFSRIAEKERPLGKPTSSSPQSI